MSMYQWLLIGISGVTCGGKTTLTHRLRDLLVQHFQCLKRNVQVMKISQDDYFLQPDDCRHVLLPSLGHTNWELPTAVDFDRLHSTVLKIISGEGGAVSVDEKCAEADLDAHSTKQKNLLKGILLIEGFLVLNHNPISSLCHLGYYILLSRATCTSRRLLRSYDPPDIPGYFEHCVWPEHIIRRGEVIGKGKIIDKSDPLTMMEVQEEDKKDSITKTSIAFHDQNHSLDVESEGASFSNVLHNSNNLNVKSDFYMRVGGNVLPLANFGNAGLGLIDKVRILSGEAMDIESMTSLVFSDVLREIERLKFK